MKGNYKVPRRPIMARAGFLLSLHDMKAMEGCRAGSRPPRPDRFGKCHRNEELGEGDSISKCRQGYERNREGGENRRENSRVEGDPG